MGHTYLFCTGVAYTFLTSNKLSHIVKPNYSTQSKVVGSSHEALPSSNDDTSHSSISEPQPTVSSQDVSTHAIFHQEGSDVTSSCNTTNDQQPVTINNPEDVHFYQQTDHFHQQTHQELHLHQKTQHFHQQTNVLQVLYPTVQNLNIEQQQQHLPLLVQNQEQQYISQQPQPNLPQYTNRQPIPFHVLNPAQQHRQHIHRQPGPQTPHAHTLALAGKLEQIMRKKTVQFYGEIILPPGVLVPGCSIEPVPLQLATARQIADNEWERNKNQRQKLHRMYIPQGSIQIEDLFEEAKQVAQQDVRYKNREAKSEYIKKFGNIVSVIGLPGIGKSTLTKIIAKCIVKDKTMKPDTQFVFPISLKNFNPNEKITLLQFLLHDNLSEWNHSDEENKALVQFLYNNRNVVLLIDGLDELNITQAGRSCYHCQLDSKEYPEVFVKNLLMGRLLPNAAKVITSRPGQFYELHPDYRQGLVSEVHGMDKPAKKNLTKQICGEANLENVEKLLAERPNLDALCYVPVHCIHIVACLHSSVSSGHEINSMTQVFLFTLTNYKASDHVRTSMSEREVGHELVKLAHLAYKGLAQRKLVFQQADFEEVGINEQTVDIFLHTYVEKSHHLKMRILEGKKRSYFIHLIWHEFFSAGHLLLFMSEERFRRCMDTFKHPHWEVVTRFMFGICNSTSYEDLKVIFPASMIKDYKEKKEILMSLIPGQYQVPKNYGRYQIEDMVRYAGWVHEANDEEISKRFEESLPKVIHMPVPRFLTEVSDVVFALNTFTTPHSLIVNISETDGSAGESFLRGIYGSQAKIKVLDIKAVKITDSFTQALLPHLDVMDKLDLDEWCLSIQNRIILHEAIQGLKNPKSLKVNRINGDRWSKYWFLHEDQPDDVMQILQLSPGKIKKLNILDVEMTDSTTQALLPHLDVMDKLDLDEKKLSAQNLIILHEAVERLTNPQGLTVNGIKGDRWSKYWEVYEDQPDDDVMQILQLPPGKIKELNNKNGKMTDSTTQALLPHLDVMDKLDLDEETLSAQNLIILHEAVKRLTNPQGLTVNGISGDHWEKHWKVYEDQLNDDVLQILKIRSGKIKVLEIKDVWMTDSMVQALLPHLDVMDELGLESRPNDMNLNLYMEDISRKIMDRQSKIIIRLGIHLLETIGSMSW
uniref:uncharacterized protein LOC100182137 isoform X2 n=1 Tax=Ciona intestinalis TaxID=7719 RepID=UPI000EF5365D|nr:uncharacterized protein LOC100182137 isoform X2 [Ciona intestinalis]|eukprot:XP_026695724.1 uncharacterized protein LOC100182137 isoform X2 [Ciona intestinalis]